MKSYRKAVVVSALACLLTTSAFAGEMQTGVAAPQPTPAPYGEMQTGATNGVMQTRASAGEIQISQAVSTPEAAAAMTAAALNLLQSVLTLL